MYVCIVCTVCMYVCIYVTMYVYMHIYICIYEFTCAGLSTFMNLHVQAC